MTFWKGQVIIQYEKNTISIRISFAYGDVVEIGVLNFSFPLPENEKTLNFDLNFSYYVNST